MNLILEKTNKNMSEWYKISNKLTSLLGICGCQRKLKSIVDSLVSIKEKCNGAYEGTHNRDFTGAEWLVISMLDSKGLIIHGTNCEYPIIPENELWEFIDKIKDSCFLEDN